MTLPEKPNNKLGHLIPNGLETFTISSKVGFAIPYEFDFLMKEFLDYGGLSIIQNIKKVGEVEEIEGQEEDKRDIFQNESAKVSYLREIFKQSCIWEIIGRETIKLNIPGGPGIPTYEIVTIATTHNGIRTRGKVKAALITKKGK